LMMVVQVCTVQVYRCVQVCTGVYRCVRTCSGLDDWVYQQRVLGDSLSDKQNAFWDAETLA